MTNKKAPQAAEAAQGTTNQIQNTTESAKSQIDFTELEELEELVYNAKAYTELLYGLALAEEVDGDKYNAVDFLMRQMCDHAKRLKAWYDQARKAV